MLVALFPSFSRLFRTARDESWAGPGNETISCWIYVWGAHSLVPRPSHPSVCRFIASNKRWGEKAWEQG